MNKLSRKINQSRIAILRKQLKRIDRMEHDMRKSWTPAYSQNHKEGEKPLIVAWEKYMPEALSVFRREYWNENKRGDAQYLDSIKVMRDLANRGDKWLLKAFNKTFYAFEGYRHGMVIIDMWKHSDRDSLLKALHPRVDQVDMTLLTEVDLPTYKRQILMGEAMFPTARINAADVGCEPLPELGDNHKLLMIRPVNLDIMGDGQIIPAPRH